MGVTSKGHHQQIKISDWISHSNKPLKCVLFINFWLRYCPQTDVPPMGEQPLLSPFLWEVHSRRSISPSSAINLHRGVSHTLLFVSAVISIAKEQTSLIFNAFFMLHAAPCGLFRSMRIPGLKLCFPSVAFNSSGLSSIRIDYIAHFEIWNRLFQFFLNPDAQV